MSPDSYRITENTRIVLYGAGKVGQAVKDKLKRERYAVETFVDQRAHEIEALDGLPVITLNEFLGRDFALDAVVIICLNNGNQQEAVAQQLFQSGIRRIIYLPMLLGRDADRRHFRRKCYSDITRDDMAGEVVCRYVTEDDFKPFGLCAHSSDRRLFLIARTKKTVTFWCRCERLRSCSADMISGNMALAQYKASTELFQYADKQLSDLTPYQELFKYLRGEENDVGVYLSCMGRETESEKKKMLEDRKQLFAQYEQAFIYEPQFFLDSPAYGIWNPAGYFHVVDGMHRIQYLMSKGYQSVPLAVPEEDFEKARVFEERMQGGKTN